jgi:hypothetical protein
MIRPFDYKDYRECTLMTLIGSSVIAIGAAIGAVLSGVSVGVIDRTMTKYSVPWFICWYIWCRIGSQIKIYPIEPSDKRS